MVEEVSGELDLPEPSGDWRADMHLLAGLQRALLHRHPWMIEATSHLQPLGPAIVATLEFALGALEPTGRYPRFAAAVAQGGPPAAELGAQFERLLDRILDSLVSNASQ